MKKIAFLTSVMMLGFSLFALAESPSGPMGPNPQAGDGIHDGSTLDSPNGPHGNIYNNVTDSFVVGTDDEVTAGPLGPNPDAGDGISDGSSLDSPNGPNGEAKPEY